MIVLGVEGTAHTLGVGIVSHVDGEISILANERAMVQPEDGGIHPREAAHHHQLAGPALLRKALDEAKLELKDLDGVAFSQGPGLGPCLRVAATMARAASVRAGAPLRGVNHCVAHLEIAQGLGKLTDPVLLYASGANTQIIAFERGRYRVFGETLDVGIGNALDKFARDNGMPFPGGPKIEQLALKASGDLLELPYTVKGMDMCFSGTATHAGQLVEKGASLEEVCYAFQESAFAMLVEVAERALAHTGKQSLTLGGGVACNSRLQNMAKEMCEARGVEYYCPPRPVLVDNGVMIAYLGSMHLQHDGPTKLEVSQVRPYERTDEIEVPWRN